jgi:trans-aconitate methyltransferase
MGDQPAPAGFTDCDLAGVRHLVDVGGGNGALLEDVLNRYPELTGTLLERADAVAAARTRLDAAGLTDRVTLVEGDFFDGVPVGADAYVLARVLHNWNDEHALDILARVHAAAAPGARLYVLEEILPDDPASTPAAGMVDLLMLVTLEGFDRAADEYRALLVKAGFTVTSVHGSAIEARRDGEDRHG